MPLRWPHAFTPSLTCEASPGVWLELLMFSRAVDVTAGRVNYLTPCGIPGHSGLVNKPVPSNVTCVMERKSCPHGERCPASMWTDEAVTPGG